MSNSYYYSDLSDMSALTSAMDTYYSRYLTISKYFPREFNDFYLNEGLHDLPLDRFNMYWSHKRYNFTLAFRRYRIKYSGVKSAIIEFKQVDIGSHQEFYYDEINKLDDNLFEHDMILTTLGSEEIQHINIKFSSLEFSTAK